MNTIVNRQSFFVTLFFLLVAFIVPLVSSAQTFSSPADLSGYAWSGNVGWISFNVPTNGAAIQTNGTLTGYAWSEHVGWIQFGGLSGCPSGSCTARINFDTNEFTGWGRALNYGDGWDGWLSLSSANQTGSPAYGISLNNSGTFQSGSYAWSDMVMGWTSFSAVNYDRPCVATVQCTPEYLGVTGTDVWCRDTNTICGPGEMCSHTSKSCETATNDLSVTPALVQRGDTVTVSWEAFPGMYSSCRVAGPNDSWTGLSNAGVNSSPITSTGSTFTLYCTLLADGSEVEVESVVVKLIPNVFES